MTTLAPPPARAIRVAGPADTEAVARTLARAFHDDPVVRWVMPHGMNLAAGYALYLRRMWMPHGATFTTEDRLGVACWVPPHAVRPGAMEQLRLLPALVRLAGRGLPRMLSRLTALERNHPDEPHWYLPKLAVDPDSQGRGTGSRLLEHMLERLDREGMAAYLDATTDRNRRLYERHGFVVIDEQQMPDGGPLIWRMWRSPAAVAAA